MNELTKEQEKEVRQRIDKFNEKFLQLQQEYEVVIVPIPRYVPTPNGSFQTYVDIQVGDSKYMSKPVPSPIISEK